VPTQPIDLLRDPARDDAQMDFSEFETARGGIWRICAVIDHATKYCLAATVTPTGRGDLTNEQWARLAPLLPTGRKAGRPPRWTKRQLIDGIRWRTRTGAPWRDVPSAMGPGRPSMGCSSAGNARLKVSLT
jgi:hypothetical protein